MPGEGVRRSTEPMGEPEGGDPACWMADADSPPVPEPVIVDLAEPTGEGGAIWHLPHEPVSGPPPDLDANLVQLAAEGAIGAHTNVELDVFVVVLEGSGHLVIDGTVHEVRCGTAVLVPRGCERAVLADATGLRYLSIHRRRDGLRIGPAPSGSAAR